MQTFIVCGLVGGYVYGVYKFSRNFNRTNFQRSLGTKIVLALLWPVLYVGNGSYRQNFNRTLSGKD
jgi:hypothetical protein